MIYAFSNVNEVKCLWLQVQHQHNFCGSNVTFSKITSIHGDEISLLLGIGIDFQTASMISLERTVYKIKINLHN